MPNMIEHYIEEIISEQPATRQDWMTDDYVHVVFKTNCYGNIETHDKVLPKAYWKNGKEMGYFMW